MSACDNERTTEHRLVTWRMSHLAIAELAVVPPDFVAEPRGEDDERPGLDRQEPAGFLQYDAARRELDSGLSAFARRGARHRRLLCAEQLSHAGEAGNLRNRRRAELPQDWRTGAAQARQYRRRSLRSGQQGGVRLDDDRRDGPAHGGACRPAGNISAAGKQMGCLDDLLGWHGRRPRRERPPRQGPCDRFPWRADELRQVRCRGPLGATADHASQWQDRQGVAVERHALFPARRGYAGRRLLLRGLSLPRGGSVGQRHEPREFHRRPQPDPVPRHARPLPADVSPGPHTLRGGGGVARHEILSAMGACRTKTFGGSRRGSPALIRAVRASRAAPPVHALQAGELAPSMPVRKYYLARTVMQATVTSGR